MRTWHMGISAHYRVASVGNISTDDVASPSSKKGKIRKTFERAFENIQLTKEWIIELSCKLTVLSFWDSMAIQEEECYSSQLFESQADLQPLCKSLLRK